ncbi:MAG: PHP domain-containing protein [Candidatus Cloacimonadaceae bacterium]|nr:PHP domain-containing protein [Candidatus Cloacimonadaceae bacterium]
MRWYKADLHIHSVLSPCGGLEMSPTAMIERCKELQIDWIAITDHNSMANCPAYEKIACSSGIAFTWGVEIQTSEEIHLLVYFDDKDKAMEFDKLLYDSLLPIKNDPEFFGDQVVIDENENIINVVERALINSRIWSIDEVMDIARSFSGYCVPAHIDAEANSIIGQLGFIPNPDLFDALGITAGLDVDGFLQKHKAIRREQLIRCSDAHYLGDLGSGYTSFWIERPTMYELKMAVNGEDNRKIRL